MVYTDGAPVLALETVKREVKAQHDIVKFVHRVVFEEVSLPS